MAVGHPCLSGPILLTDPAACAEEEAGLALAGPVLAGLAVWAEGNCSGDVWFDGAGQW